MDRLDQMLKAHPAPAGSDRESALAVIRATAECAAVCASCADACLAEPNVAELVGCIRLNIDCADICEMTGRFFARASARDRATLKALLRACADACRACGEECAQHAAHMEHCRICAESCRTCAEACEKEAKALV